MSQLRSTSSNELPCRRTYFYVGGEYVLEGKTHVMKDQMYVEQLDPVDGTTKAFPLVFVHGLGQTGTNWLNKPDGGRGWASFYLELGYRVYLIDCTVRGRSPGHPHENRVKTPLSAEMVEKRFTATASHSLWAQSSLHTQWPGAGRQGDPIFDTYYSSLAPSLVDKEYQQTATQKAGAALLDRIGCRVILFGHSQGMMPTWLIADARPALVQAIVALEPAGPPFDEAVFQDDFVRPFGLTTIPLTYSPPVTDPEKDLIPQKTEPTRPGEVVCRIQAPDHPVRKLVNFVDLPILLLTAEASYHAPYDYATVKYLIQAGAKKTEHLRLGDIGIHGNGHMIFLEKNSDEIATVIETWIRKTGVTKRDNTSVRL